MSKGNSLAVSLSFLLFCTCCLAWPTGNSRRSYGYNTYPQMNTQYDLGSWDVAPEPLAYDPVDEYDIDNDNLYDQPAISISDLSDLMKRYDNVPAYQTSEWNINERPESELEQLKTQERRQEHQGQKSTAAPSTSRPSSTTSATKEHGSSNRKAIPAAVETLPVPRPHQGQKEIPLLRPANTKSRNSMTSTMAQNGGSQQTESDAEPQAVIAQRRSSPVAEKPSAYDTLRKYLSIEDALQKEVQKRISGNRQMKRSSIVTDTESLAGQLNNLKKTVM